MPQPSKYGLNIHIISVVIGILCKIPYFYFYEISLISNYDISNPIVNE